MINKERLKEILNKFDKDTLIECFSSYEFKPQNQNSILNMILDLQEKQILLHKNFISIDEKKAGE